MVEPLLAIEGLEVAYNRVAIALHGISLRVEPSTIVALLGNNGAGKTTTLRAVSGFIGLDNARVIGGSVTLARQRIENLAPSATTALGVVLVPEREKVFPNLTVAENLAAVSSRQVHAAERRRLEGVVFQFFPPLMTLRSRLAGLLSGGERQMLGIASALMCKPKLLMIDELSLGLAPIVVEDLIQRLEEIRKELRISILLVEQNASIALEVADYGYVLENGRVVLEGEAAILRDRREIQDAYFGRTPDAGERSYRVIKSTQQGIDEVGHT
jgi:branched-chain amino acid transport system ATP-binding protein